MELFNPDGSIKLSQTMLDKKKNETNRMKGRSLKVRKDIVNDRSPKKCALRITFGEGVHDTSFFDKVYSRWNARTDTPAKFKRISEKELEIEIGTDFRRCSDCTSLVSEIREFIDVIEDKGTCTYRRESNFCYEDYFE